MTQKIEKLYSKIIDFILLTRALMIGDNHSNKQLKGYANKSISSKKGQQVYFKKRTDVAGKVYGPTDGRVELPREVVRQLQGSSFAAKHLILFGK